jgi:transcriptional regulator with PAS, ATPase and Fis domain
MNISSWEKSIFDALYDGVLIADENCIVVYVNPSYTRITKVEYHEIVGFHVAAARKGSKLPEVIKSGKRQLGVRRKVDEIEYIVNMVPLLDKGEIAGGISILNEINDIYNLTEELKKSNSIIKALEKRVKQMGKAKYSFDDIIGETAESMETKKLALKISEKEMNVLITGESGTGKELYANSIHNASSRREYPFVAVNCATLESNLLESELFGYEEGAFTGAKKGGKIGLFQEANGGTIFLDEISEMDYRLQAKLLRTLQENVVRPIGGVSEKPIDVRVIAATNKELEKMIEHNKFRRDLYYRIAIFSINIPPLRSRRGDINDLIGFFLRKMEEKLKVKIDISEESMNILHNYDWPGNIRELRNTIEFSANMTDDFIIKPVNLPKLIQTEGIKKNIIKLRPLEEIIRETESSEINKAVLTYGNTVEGKKKAAEALGISLATLYNKLK